MYSRERNVVIGKNDLKESILYRFFKCSGCDCHVHARYIAIMCYLHNSKIRFTRLY